MKRALWAGLFLLGLCGLAARPAEAQCEACRVYYGWFEDEFLVYELCTAPDFPRNGFLYCQSDGQPISYGGYCYESGSLCRWTSFGGSPLEGSAICTAPAPGICAWSA